MPDEHPPSEYGGKTRRANRLQGASPDGEFIHMPTSSEKLSLIYRTGVDVQGEEDLDAPEDSMAFEGGEWSPEGYTYNRRTGRWEQEEQ